MERYQRKGLEQWKLVAAHTLLFAKTSALILDLLRSFQTCTKQTYFSVNLVEVIWKTPIIKFEQHFVLDYFNFSFNDVNPCKTGPILLSFLIRRLALASEKPVVGSIPNMVC